ncbi:MAG TPA: hypothetical protein DDW65_19530 [Firmicutes bacterium]|nr:hypothetical protein [Bacillota bacterium]
MYDGIQKSSIIFSEDSQRFAYVAQNFGQYRMVVDGKEVTAADKVSNAVFSPDSKRVAFLIRKKDEDYIVLDGKESSYQNIFNLPIFSPDSKCIAFVVGNLKATPGAIPTAASVVINSRKGKQYDIVLPQSVRFSPNGDHLVYVAMKNKKWFTVLDGKEGKPYEAILFGSKGIVFEDDETYRYIAVNGRNLVSVEEKIIE